jgi:hypothetical protein
VVARLVNPLRDLASHQLEFASIAITQAYQLAGLDYFRPPPS